MKREKYQAMKKAVEAKRQARAEAVPMPAVELVKPQPAESPVAPRPKKEKPPRTPLAADRQLHHKGRFPAGTFFTNPAWDGTNWRTTLQVPIDPPEVFPGRWKEFPGEDTALHRLFVRLYAEYRQWADAQAKEVPLA